ncbi:hypothetical protein PoB_006887000 [Plakobranchus ocellatus]|uniref:Uncharacterized protein n=1 Tax=Plakobranchus ocellatus TaxID=259542 RepID=A0AAV4DEC5_9GAST|nr:hypothetical protein PoB_006887000 [Plakobranchus ocellatus]
MIQKNGFSHDKSTRSLKCFFLLRSSIFGALHSGHFIPQKEKKKPTKIVLGILEYDKRNRIIYVNLKMENFLSGRKGGYTKFPTLSASGTEQTDTGFRRIDQSRTWKSFFPLLHVTLGFRKHIVGISDTNGDRCKHLCKAFAWLTWDGLVFDGPQIRRLNKDQAFTHSITEIEKYLWKRSYFCRLELCFANR